MNPAGSHSDGGRDEKEVVQWLGDRRPLPRPAFRGDLRRELAAVEAKQRWQPPRLRLAILAYSLSGIALLALAAAGVAGLGPFGT